MLRGNVRFTALAMGEGSFSFLTPTVQLKAKAAFIDPDTGKTHGWTETGAGWSPETIRKLEELKECMERDLAAVHFEGHESSSSGITRKPAGAPSGLGEHLQADEAQI